MYRSKISCELRNVPQRIFLWYRIVMSPLPAGVNGSQELSSCCSSHFFLFNHPRRSRATAGGDSYDRNHMQSVLKLRQRECGEVCLAAVVGGCTIAHCCPLLLPVYLCCHLHTSSATCTPLSASLSNPANARSCIICTSFALVLHLQLWSVCISVCSPSPPRMLYES